MPGPDYPVCCGCKVVGLLRGSYYYNAEEEGVRLTEYGGLDGALA
jgi:hypothetical protein